MQTRKLRTAGLLLLILLAGIVLGRIWFADKPTVMAFPTDPGTLFEPGPTTASKPGEHGLLTVVRPIGTEIAAGDSVMLALHWEKAAGPLSESDFSGTTFLRAETIESLNFTITAPGSKPVTIQPQKVAHLRTWGLGSEWHLARRPTLILSLSEQGLSESFLWDPAKVMPIPWQTKAPGLWDQPGQYEIAITGTIHLHEGVAIPFASEPVPVRIGGPGLKSRAEIEEAAWSSLRATFPGGIGLDDRAHASPLNTALMVQNAAGNYVVRFACHGEIVPGHRDFRVEVRPDGKVTTIYSRDVFTCVASGTLIDAESGPVPIQRIAPGDRVWGWDVNRRTKVLGKVLHVRQGFSRETITLCGRLKVTAQHPVFTTAGWKQAGQIRAEDLLLTSDLQEIPAGTPTHLSEPVPVFDLTVEGVGNFFANGILVHNKIMSPAPKYHEDPWITLWPRYPFPGMGTVQRPAFTR